MAHCPSLPCFILIEVSCVPCAFPCIDFLKSDLSLFSDLHYLSAATLTFGLSSDYASTLPALTYGLSAYVSVYSLGTTLGRQLSKRVSATWESPAARLKAENLGAP